MNRTFNKVKHTTMTNSNQTKETIEQIRANQPLYAVKYEKRHRTANIVSLYKEGYIADPKRQLYLQTKHHVAMRKCTDCQNYGVNVYACTDCGDVIEVKMSCHHRFCPRCGAAASNKWAEKLGKRLLPMLHGHLVFTLPFYLRKLCKFNEKLMYDLLFSLAAQAVREIMREKYGIEVGIICVLHTFGSDLKYHPHIHLIVSCGGVKNGKIRALKHKYLVQHTELAKRFEDLFKAELVKLYGQSALNTEGVIDEGQDMTAFIEKNDKKGWIIGLNLEIQNVDKLIGYCGRYLRRACLSEYRIKSIDKGMISFDFKDYKNTPKDAKTTLIATKTMTSTAFLDALLQHVPDKGFVGVRYYGIYANGSKALKKIQEAEKLSTKRSEREAQFPALKAEKEEQSDLAIFRQYQIYDFLLCPCCGIERTHIESYMHGKRFYLSPLVNDS